MEELATLAKNVQNAGNIQELYAAMQDYTVAYQQCEDDDLRDQADVLADINRLPTWGPAYRMENDSVYSWDESRILVMSNSPDDDGWVLDARDDIILPTRWTWDEKREEFYVVIPGPQSIHLTVWAERSGWSWKIEHGEDTLASDTRENSAQDAADAAIEALVDWMQNVASSAAMLDFVRVGHGNKKAVQTELATILGVTQATISWWVNSENGMICAVRTHIMRMQGIQRIDAPEIAKWQIFG